MTYSDRIDSVRRAQRFALGAMAFLAGADKFTNLFVDWGKYLSPALAGLLPVDRAVLMPLVGVIEVAVGLAILTRWTREGAYVAAVWLVAVAINLVTAGFYDVAVRDVVIAVGAYSLARLTEAADEASESAAAAPARAAYSS